MLDKASVRSTVRAAIQAMSTEERTRRSAVVAQHFLSSDLYRGAQIIFAYASSAREVSTKDILERSLADGKVLALPHTGVDGSELTFHRVTDLAKDLEPGRFGILEPLESAPKIEIAEADLVIVPGVAFTKSGERLGQGGGFYDRFLAKLPSGVARCGLAFDCQIVTSLPTEAHDEKVSHVFAESGSIG